MRLLRSFLDNSMEIAIACLRLLALLAVPAFIGTTIGTLWLGEDHLDQWVGTLITIGVFGLAAGFAGFYTFGNPEWRRGAPND